MSEQASAPIRAVPPQAQLIEMARGHQVSSMLRVAAQLKLADYLSEGPRTAEERRRRLMLLRSIGSCERLRVWGCLPRMVRIGSR